MISDARGRHVSPGIYTEEKDVVYSVKSLGITSLGVAGETLYGPAFQPIDITEWSEFVDYFGGTDTSVFPKNGNPKYELPYVAKSYLEKSKRLSVVRVLGLSGYDAGKAWVLKRGDKPVLVLRGKKEYKPENYSNICNGADDDISEIVTNIVKTAYTQTYIGTYCKNEQRTDVPQSNQNKFGIKVTYKENEQYKNVTYYVSLDKNDTDYIYNVLSSDPEKSDYIYIDGLFDMSSDGSFGAFNEITDANECYKVPFRYAQTPWLVSESIITSGTTTEASVNTLFKFITISDGDAANYQVKVSIEKINPINGTFDVVVRDFNDDDNNPVVLEKFSSCTLTKGDPSYIGFKIGTADGAFIPKSKYILVQFSNNNASISGHIPCGFLGYEFNKKIDVNAPEINYNLNYNPQKRSKVQYFGLNKGMFNYDILKYHGQYPETTIYTDGFHMENFVNGTPVYVDGKSGYKFQTVSGEKVSDVTMAPTMSKDKVDNTDAYKETIYKDEKLRKFTVYFYGGFDGWDINRGMRTNTDAYNASKYDFSGSSLFNLISDLKNDQYENGDLKYDLQNINLPSTAITTDYYAYMAGYRCFANPSDIDINVFATPGIDWKNNKMLTSDVIDMIEDKDDGRGGDCLYVMNCPNGEEIDELVSDFEDSEIDTSYACTYYPWIVYFDNTQSQYIKLPVTKDVVRNMADTDNVSFPWYAPAGFNRGNVDCVMADFKTTLSQEDDLYSNMINPVKTFGVDGVKIWGNKTAYSIESPLNRVNVRRLMIRVKKLVTSAARNLIFEQYSDTLEKQFRGLVEPILAEVKSNRGITDYRVLTEVTPETRDQHILPAKILIKPTPALEYISISFVVYPESVDFMDE